MEFKFNPLYRYTTWTLYLDSNKWGIKQTKLSMYNFIPASLHAHCVQIMHLIAFEINRHAECIQESFFNKVHEHFSANILQTGSKLIEFVFIL